MTRLRVKPKNESLVNKEALKEIEGVIGVVEEETLQIILGPGKVAKVYEEFKILMKNTGEWDLNEQAKQKREEIKEKNKTPFKLFLRRIANIFIPLIPALVASGLITGVTKSVVQAGWIAETSMIATVLTVMGSGLFSFLGILVGLNAAKEFGGSPALGALAGILVINPEIANISLFGEELVPGRGGLIGVMFAAIFIAFWNNGSAASSRKRWISLLHRHWPC